ncbi:YciI family protein [Sporomusa acidovorans]|uniref:YCII-related domain-containing protein n=1 Tax=Sporomusa acidovorans (strain ATCC 49682 / DSM 3132 / Mol) TaxID=1123286 RepID=A0ABZ3J596_SPOA4|nr:YciI family protein [Sporomusa acidovorans]OZC15688.1 YCII-related domain protein [Sporomusa acidovorans DSM 3132]SDE88946.1 Uncharacterized conserved protein YciI, contains a putative active-site phosphohistidine [Sporomusa acidovorans]
MFLVITTYQKSIDQIEKFLPAHSAFLDNYYASKQIIFSGRRNPRIGGMILFNVEKQSDVLAIIEKDPFNVNGIAKYELFEFIPTKYDKDFEKFIHLN